MCGISCFIKKLPSNFFEAYNRWKRGELTGTEAAKLCGMPLSTFRYKVGKLKDYSKTETFDLQ